MNIKYIDLRKGSRVEFSFNGINKFSGTVLEVDILHQIFKVDYPNIDLQHKREQVIPFEYLLSITNSEIDEGIKRSIMKQIGKQIIH